MLTREQIEEIQAESREKGLSIKKILDEKGIPVHQYFWWKKKYARESLPEGFIPVSGGMPPAVMAAIGAGSRGKSKSDSSGENWMSIELRTVSGTDMRIQGGLTPTMVYTILKSV